MSEKNFQRALLHLYAIIDQCPVYSAANFEKFDLSRSEQQSLEEIMTSQRDRLLVFSQLLCSKRRRSIEQVLPKSRELAGCHLDALLNAYLSCPMPEGARDPMDAIRTFADYVGTRRDEQTNVSKELEFIHFEATYASVSLPLASRRFNETRPLQVSTDLRLSRHGNAALIHCTHDVGGAMTDSSVLGVPARPPRPTWYFLFQARTEDVRVLAVSPALAGVLQLMRRGLSLGEVLRTLRCGTETRAALASVENLLALGAPFISQDASPDPN